MPSNPTSKTEALWTKIPTFYKAAGIGIALCLAGFKGLNHHIDERVDTKLDPLYSMMAFSLKKQGVWDEYIRTHEKELHDDSLIRR